MNLKTAGFLVALFFIVGLVIGYNLKSKTDIIEKPIEAPPLIIKDTIVVREIDTIRIPITKVKYYTKTDTVLVNKIQVVSDSFNCVTFPLMLSDSSKISVTECSKEKIPLDLTFDAKYIDKREHIRIINNSKTDTIKIKPKKLGFAIGPSAGVGIDVNNIKQPVYFIGATLTYGWRF